MHSQQITYDDVLYKLSENDMYLFIFIDVL